MKKVTMLLILAAVMAVTGAGAVFAGDAHCDSDHNKKDKVKVCVEGDNIEAINVELDYDGLDDHKIIRVNVVLKEDTRTKLGISGDGIIRGVPFNIDMDLLLQASSESSVTIRGTEGLDIAVINITTFIEAQVP